MVFSTGLPQPSTGERVCLMACNGWTAACSARLLPPLLLLLLLVMVARKEARSCCCLLCSG